MSTLKIDATSSQLERKCRDALRTRATTILAFSADIKGSLCISERSLSESVQ
jgi:hypothetical protein